VTNRLSAFQTPKRWFASESFRRTLTIGGRTSVAEWEDVFELTLLDSGDIAGRQVHPCVLREHVYAIGTLNQARVFKSQHVRAACL
jgi:hypothetical protein